MPIEMTEPLLQDVYIIPLSQRLLQYGKEDSNVYFDKSTNDILKPWVLGNTSGFIDTTSSLQSYKYRTSCILDGLICENELNGNILTVTVGHGSCIVDDILIVFPIETVLDLDLTEYGIENNCGKVLISVNFHWIQNINDNSPKLKISYQDYDNLSLVEPNGWSTVSDQLILNVIEFNKNTSGDVISSSIIQYIENPFLNTFHQQITVKGYVYEIAPLPKIYYHLMNSLSINFPRLSIHVIPPYVDTNLYDTSSFYTPNIPPVDASPSDYLYYWKYTNVLPDGLIADPPYFFAYIPLGDIHGENVIVQCYIDNMIILPAFIEYFGGDFVNIWMPGNFVAQNNMPEVKVISCS